MSLKSRFLSILTVVFASLAFATFTFAQDSKATTPAPEKADKQWNGKHGDHGQGEGRHGHGGMMRMFEGLNLTDAQKTQIHSIMEANKPSDANRDEMRTLWEAKKNGTLTAEQQARLDTLRQQSGAHMKAVHEQILNVLTPEQKAQFEKNKAERKQRHEQLERAPAATAPAQEG